MMCVVLTTLPSFSFSIAVTEVWNFDFFCCKIFEILNDLVRIWESTEPNRFLKVYLIQSPSKLCIIYLNYQDHCYQCDCRAFISFFKALLLCLCEAGNVISKSKSKEFASWSCLVSSTNLMFCLIVLSSKWNLIRP
jgi:hypothetical protein